MLPVKRREFKAILKFTSLLALLNPQRDYPACVLQTLIDQLKQAQPLSTAQIADAVRQLISESVAVEVKADFLIALAAKGESPEEIAAFAMELRELSIQPPLDVATRSLEILDVCGTGGDHLGTFNISTTVAIVCAAAGVTVAKHGNRAITSKSGSADVLEALGVKIDLSPEEASRRLRDHGFAFFFAPNYHPAFKHIAPVRKLCASRGQRTIFNFLGPLLNPARPTAQLMGVPSPDLCEPMARVLQTLGVRRAMVVCGTIDPLRLFRAFDFDPTNRIHTIRVVDSQGGSQFLKVNDAVLLAKRQNAILVEVAPNASPPVCRMVEFNEIERVRKANPEKNKRLDELSTLGENSIAEFYQERGFTTSTFDPNQFPLQPATLDDLIGGDRETNAEIIRRILRGEDRGPKRDAVLLNAGAALFVAGSVRSMSDGWEKAALVLDNGAAWEKLVELSRS